MSAVDPLRTLAAVGPKKRGTAQSERHPTRKLVRQHQLLKQHVAGDVSIGGAVAAARYLLAIVALQVRVHLIVARNLLGRSRDAITHRDEVEIRLILSRIVVAENIIGFDPT